ncbi:MAG: peptidase C69 [Candidatus Hermodarchaeota archaeon]
MCDTLVALGNSTEDGNVIFGKNSDRPQDEAQLITYSPRTKYSNGEQVRCTYISIPQVKETAAVYMSQPFWMFGCEMGSNEYGVVIGNEAVYSKEEYHESGLLGMDLLRLGLERGKSAKEALDVMTNLLEIYGQGGSCAYGRQGWIYHNSYIIADKTEAYVLETADKWWIVETVKEIRSISNNLSIRGKGDLRRKGIIQHAIEKGYCKDDDHFDFAMIFSDPQIPSSFPLNSRDGCTSIMLRENRTQINPSKMMEFLREHDVGICMHGSFQSTSSQVSHLKKNFEQSVHWFTGGSLPCLNVFKPYIFPLEGEKLITLEPGPYKELDPEWFWSRHKNFIKPYKKRSIKPEKQIYIDKIMDIENSIISNEKAISKKASSQSRNEMISKYLDLNKKAWDLAEKLIM